PPTTPHSSTLSLHDALPIFLINSITQFERLNQSRVARWKKRSCTQLPQKQKRKQAPNRQKRQEIENIDLESARMNERQYGHISVDRKSTRLNSSHGSISYAV